MEEEAHEVARARESHSAAARQVANTDDSNAHGCLPFELPMPYREAPYKQVSGGAVAASCFYS